MADTILKNNKKHSLINWSELSRFLTNGDRSGIRPNDIPLKYQKEVSELIKLIDDWSEKVKKNNTKQLRL